MCAPESEKGTYDIMEGGGGRNPSFGRRMSDRRRRTEISLCVGCCWFSAFSL